MKTVSIIGGFVAIIVYILWYNYMFNNYPNVQQIYNDIANMTIYGVLSLSFFALGRHENNTISRLFVFYAIGEFWAFLVTVMIYNTFIYDAVVYHKTITAILMVLSLNFIVGLIYLIKWYYK